MKCQIPEISWHNRDPVLSVDVQPKNVVGHLRLASGGTDSHVLVWYIKEDNEEGYTLEVASDLTRHQKAVNVVRWSPNGELLASGDDDSVIFIWRLKPDAEHKNICDDSTSATCKETWITLKMLRGHMEDVYDLNWAPTSLHLVSASVDNSAIIWDINKGKHCAILQESQGFVQGVAWDPKNRFLVTLSSDRSFRTYDVSNFKMVAKSTKCTLPLPASHPLHGHTQRLYHDDTLQTFFRRCSFSPDGALVVAPSGVLDGVKQHASFIYLRNNWKTPSLVLPSDQYTVAARFCPLIFQLFSKRTTLLPLPYRMVFAIATKSSVYLYDTQQKTPFAVISNIHYTRLTDLTWSSDGRLLIVSSTDGFCSLIKFEIGELGVPYDTKTSNSNLNLGQNKEAPKEVGNNVSNKKIEVPIDKIFSVDDKFTSPVKNKPATPIAIRKRPRTESSTEPKRHFDGIKFAENETTQDIKLLVDDEDNVKTPVPSEKEEKVSTIPTSDNQQVPTDVQKSATDKITPKAPRRVEFRTISTPKSRKKLL